MRDLVLDNSAPFIPFVLTKRKKDIEYEAKAVTLAGRRYIVCRNREEIKKDAAARAAILAALERQLKKGDKSLVGNKGYRRFLATHGDDRFAIDRAKAEEDAKFDGVFVLSNQCRSFAAGSDALLQSLEGGTGLPHIEKPVRDATDLHKLDETIRGHVSCSFLALVLKKELEDRIANLGKPAAEGEAESGSWPDILADLNSLTETEVAQDGKRFLLRSASACRKPRPSRRRRRFAAHRPANRRRLTLPPFSEM